LANGKIDEILNNITEEVFDREMASSFPTLHKTIFHIWDAETIWFARINGFSLNE
jgi:uncharacterized damage-inducible protein DinB